MQFARVSRTTAETVYTVVTNAEASSITTGMGVAFSQAAASAYGAVGTNYAVKSGSGA